MPDGKKSSPRHSVIGADGMRLTARCIRTCRPSAVLYSVTASPQCTVIGHSLDPSGNTSSDQRRPAVDAAHGSPGHSTMLKHFIRCKGRKGEVG